MKDNEVIVKGGLGNQLFCVFFAYKLLLNQKNKVHLNLTNYLINKRKDRVFVLDNLYPSLTRELKIRRGIFSKCLYFFVKFYELFFVEENPNTLPGDNPFIINYWPNRYIYSGYFQQINNIWKCILFGPLRYSFLAVGLVPTMAYLLS